MLLLLAGACTLEPAGTDAEFQRLSRAGAAWQSPPEERVLPELSSEPSAEDLVARALLANGELEATWHAWRAALERVLVASGWPNTDFAVGLTKFVEQGSLWDTSAISFGFDPMQMLLLPPKVRKAGEVAFAEALAAGQRFESLRVALRERVLTAWWDGALLAERVRVQTERLALAQSLADSAAAGVTVGRSQSALLDRQVQTGMLRLELETLQAEIPAWRAALNGQLARAPDAALSLPAAASLPAPVPLPSDADILRAGVAAYPALSELMHLADARDLALALADQRWWPNIAPTATASGGASESLGVMITLPTTVPAVAAAVRAARADVDEARARLRQAGHDTRAQLVATLATVRNDEQRLQRLREQILPVALALRDNARFAYTNGLADLAALTEARETALDVELLLAEARAALEQHRAMLERVAGVELRAETRTTPIAAGDLP